MLSERQRTLYLILCVTEEATKRLRKNCKGFLTRRALYSYSKECPFPLKTSTLFLNSSQEDNASSYPHLIVS